MPDTERIKAEIKKLDYLEGNGILGQQKRQLVDERFLFISSGGTGHFTLSALRKTLQRWVDPDELRTKVRYLAVDAMKAELDRMKQEEGFSEEEVYFLPYEGAHESIHPKKMTPQMAAWVHPDLYRETGGEGSGMGRGFDDNGSGAWRQVGRVRLCQSAATETIRRRVNRAVVELRNAEQGGVGSKLNVFFLAGLAGGTGSGTIIDLAFLVHQILKNLSQTVYEQTNFSAYLLLPSACDGEPNAKGNRNAYAALKEIDYFMQLQGRDEHYTLDYNGFSVDISSNIFSFCTLVEGVTDEGAFFSDQADVARQVTANSIMNLIATPAKSTNNETPFMVDAFLSNKHERVSAQVMGINHMQWPRNENYHYNVIGYSRCVVPRDLITVYAANRVFNRVWAEYDKCRLATDEAADAFLLSCGLNPNALYKAKTLKTVRKDVDREINAQFRAYGPYFMVNLTKKAAAMLQGERYQGFASSKAKTALLRGSRERWMEVFETYSSVGTYLSGLNHQLYEAYTTVLDELRKLLRENANLITDTQEFKSRFSRSYSWSPIDLTSGEGASETVRKWLAALIPDHLVEASAQRFMDNLCSKKDAWTGVGGALDVANEVRGFVNREFGALVSATVELFLLKLYGSADAVVPSLPEEQEREKHIPVRKAAHEIVTRLDASAGALVQTDGGFHLNNCYKNNYISVPQTKWLGAKIKEEAGAIGTSDVYLGSGSDEIVFYRLYAGVPAWALAWVNQAEPTYLLDSSETGLHIERQRDGIDWAAYPNLGRNAGEKELAQRSQAAQDLTQAMALGLVLDVTPEGEAVHRYKLCLPEGSPALQNAREQAAEAADKLFGQLDLARERVYTMREVLSLMEEKKLLSRHDLLYAETQAATPANPVPTDFGWELAQRDLRRNILLWQRLRAFLPTAQSLTELVDAHNSRAEQLHNSLAREETFFYGLYEGLLRYDELDRMWILYDGVNRVERGLGGELKKQVERECAEYYGAVAFYRLSEADYANFKQGLEGKQEQNDTAAKRAAREAEKQWKARFQAKREARTRTEEILFPMAAPGDRFENAVGGAETAQKIREFYDRIQEY